MNFEEIIQQKFNEGATSEEIADEITEALNAVIEKQKVVDEYVEKAAEYCNLYIGVKHPEGKKITVEDLQNLIDMYTVLDDVIADTLNKILPLDKVVNTDVLSDFVNKMGW